MKDETTDWSDPGWSVHREPRTAASITPEQLVPDALGGANGSHCGFQTEVVGAGPRP
jgi:hypothetical protein